MPPPPPNPLSLKTGLILHAAIAYSGVTMDQLMIISYIQTHDLEIWYADRELPRTLKLRRFANLQEGIDGILDVVMILLSTVTKRLKVSVLWDDGTPADEVLSNVGRGI